ncbi:MAG TPA: glutathione synthetase [Thermoanaerobaculia bacterium]|nr:glutathione synthetase [Thermoanaerobaculia bacterium]
MRIGFLVNDLATERPDYTTTALALAALQRGHEPWYIGVEDFVYDPRERVVTLARSVPAARKRPPASRDKLLELLRGDDARREELKVDDLDVLMLRNDPADDAERPWAQTVGLLFGQLAVRHGVLVVNDPVGLAQAINKLYFQLFPEEVRPKTLITRDSEQIRRFLDELGGTAVLKPLQGSGGKNVFAVRDGDVSNLNQIITAIGREGYIVTQELLPEAASQGDVRMFLMNGDPLRVDGKYCAYRREPSGGDLRSNLSAGGEVRPVEIDDKHLRVAELVRPKLIQDGMFLVGLDIVGDKLMEVNVFSPGGIEMAGTLAGVDFASAIVAGLERKIEWQGHYHGNLGNAGLATI